ncbi:hypothetical protein PUNSTDRAFT_131808 [Punctularia strigosozonata HHB-11173 SS5]|uniref:uncharacterized protein n=1 Tax=Punctularia strigosozonata (strain HHB-11173) TaxID=741275 RepID=UPI0004418316|nr:uncharacterized protein PUNSTDRAFT_131808 [Punctularia strigosozonata HHB-11173 SS5]EIN11649.1 hypothetical protein PUNSTDRAFT_131808 [Punctularia strigosozonata HHB-11173 SS5]
MNTIRHWIKDYVISVAEKHGGNLSSVPVHDKSGKAQLIQACLFCAFFNSSESLDSSRSTPEPTAVEPIWAVISDKEHTIPVRLTQEAVEHHNMTDLTKNRLTKHRGAVVRVKSFKLVFRRRPLGGQQKGMTAEQVITLDVDAIEVIGSSEEAVFGDPTEISCDPLVARWIQGLRDGGGGGNVLKLEKVAGISATAAAGQQTRVKLPPGTTAESPRKLAAKKHTAAPAISTSATTTNGGRKLDKPNPLVRDLERPFRKYLMPENRQKYSEIPKEYLKALANIPDPSSISTIQEIMNFVSETASKPKEHSEPQPPPQSTIYAGSEDPRFDARSKPHEDPVPDQPLPSTSYIADSPRDATKSDSQERLVSQQPVPSMSSYLTASQTKADGSMQTTDLHPMTTPGPRGRAMDGQSNVPKIVQTSSTDRMYSAAKSTVIPDALRLDETPDATQFVSKIGITQPGQSQPTPSLVRQRTPSEWASSPPRSPKRRKVTPLDPNSAMDDDTADTGEGDTPQSAKPTNDILSLSQLSQDSAESDEEDIASIFESSSSPVRVAGRARDPTSPFYPDPGNQDTCTRSLSYPRPLAQLPREEVSTPSSPPPHASSTEISHRDGPPAEASMPSQAISGSSVKSQESEAQETAAESVSSATRRVRERASALLTPGSSPLPKGKVLVPASDTSASISQNQSQNRPAPGPQNVASAHAAGTSDEGTNQHPEPDAKQNRQPKTRKEELHLGLDVSSAGVGDLATLLSVAVVDDVKDLEGDDAGTRTSLYGQDTSKKSKARSEMPVIPKEPDVFLDDTSAQLRKHSEIGRHESASSMKTAECILNPLAEKSQDTLAASYACSNQPKRQPSPRRSDAVEVVDPAPVRAHVPRKSDGPTSLPPHAKRIFRAEQQAVVEDSPRTKGRLTNPERLYGSASKAEGSHNPDMWVEPSFMRKRAARPAAGSSAREDGSKQRAPQTPSTEHVNTSAARRTYSVVQAPGSSSRPGSDSVPHINLSMVHASSTRTRKRNRLLATSSDEPVTDARTPRYYATSSRTYKRLKTTESIESEHSPLTNPPPAQRSDARPKLGGFKPFSSEPSHANPSDIGWPRLTEILLTTGQTRTRDAKRHRVS